MSNTRIIRALELIHDIREDGGLRQAWPTLDEVSRELELHIAETQAQERRRKLALVTRGGR